MAERRKPTAEEIAADKARKQAKAINAPKGTKLAAKGTKLRDQQNEYARRKQGSDASSKNRSTRTGKMADNIIKYGDPFANKTIDKVNSLKSK